MMIRLGARSEDACEFDLDHIFMCRLKLLIIMARTYLENYPLGKVRKSAIISNAAYITAESIDLEQLIPIRSRRHGTAAMNFDHVFFQRVKRLAYLAEAVAADAPVGQDRQAALKDNLERICSFLRFTSGIKKVEFLKVA